MANQATGVGKIISLTNFDENYWQYIDCEISERLQQFRWKRRRIEWQ